MFRTKKLLLFIIICMIAPCADNELVILIYTRVVYTLCGYNRKTKYEVDNKLL